MDSVMETQTVDRTETDRFEYIELERLVESGHNPRHHFDETKLEELTQSVREKGIVEPLVVRVIELDLFEIIAGARRFRAATRAGLSVVPCIVREYSDEDVLELFLVENGQRDDLTPLEQARGYQQLLAANPDKYSAATIATKVGKSPAWVWDRLRLLHLVPEAEQLLERGQISVGHAIVIARLKPEEQLAVVGTGRDQHGRLTGGLWQQERGLFAADEDEDDDPVPSYKPVSIRELEGWIADHIRFDVEHMAQVLPLEFGPLREAVDARRQVVSITTQYFVPEGAGSDVYPAHAWRRADGRRDSQTCAHAVLGVVVTGPSRGQAFDVCVANDECEVHFAEAIAEKRAKAEAKKATGKKPAKSNAEKTWQQQEKERRERQEAWEAIKPHVCAAAFEQVKHQQALTPQQAQHFTYELPFDCDVVQAQLGEDWYTKLGAAVLVSEIVGYSQDFTHFLDTIAKPLGLDLKPLQAAYDAHAPKPEPKPAKKTRGRK